MKKLNKKIKELDALADEYEKTRDEEVKSKWYKLTKEINHEYESKRSTTVSR